MAAAAESKATEQFGSGVEGENRGVAQAAKCFLDWNKKLKCREGSSGRENRRDDLEVLPHAQTVETPIQRPSATDGRVPGDPIRIKVHWVAFRAYPYTGKRVEVTRSSRGVRYVLR